MHPLHHRRLRHPYRHHVLLQQKRFLTPLDQHYPNSHRLLHHLRHHDHPMNQGQHHQQTLVESLTSNASCYQKQLCQMAFRDFRSCRKRILHHQELRLHHHIEMWKRPSLQLYPFLSSLKEPLSGLVLLTWQS